MSAARVIPSNDERTRQPCHGRHHRGDCRPGRRPFEMCSLGGRASEQTERALDLVVGSKPCVHQTPRSRLVDELAASALALLSAFGCLLSTVGRGEAQKKTGPATNRRVLHRDHLGIADS